MLQSVGVSAGTTRVLEDTEAIAFGMPRDS